MVRELKSKLYRLTVAVYTELRNTFLCNAVQLAQKPGWLCCAWTVVVKPSLNDTSHRLPNVQPAQRWTLHIRVKLVNSCTLHFHYENSGRTLNLYNSLICYKPSFKKAVILYSALTLCGGSYRLFVFFYFQTLI